jgi:leader peptidase (prepilin peptidase)/N-methyltransferase
VALGYPLNPLYPFSPNVYLIVAAAGWGMAAGLVSPRAAYRLAVEPDEPWRRADAVGVPFPPGIRAWVGRGQGGVPQAVLCGAVCAGLATTVGARPELAVWLLLVPLCVLLGRVDLAVRRLPDVLTLPAVVGTATLLGGAALLPGHEGSWGRALAGGGVLGALYFVLHLVNPGGMGFGDVKLAPAVGLALGWYGWNAVIAGTLAGFGLGACAGLLLLATRRADRRTLIPFGPFMLVGALSGVLLATA